MEVRSQPDVPAAVPDERLPRAWWTVWVPETAEILWTRERALAIAGSQTTILRSSLYRLRYLDSVFYEIMREKREENKTRNVETYCIILSGAAVGVTRILAVCAVKYLP
jgi:hypothetical protein